MAARDWDVKGIAAMPIAVGLGGFAMIDGGNPDFLVLDHDPLVVASLVAFIALLPVGLAVVDGLLDRVMPHARTGRSLAAIAYAVLTGIGGLLGIMLLATSTGDPKVLAFDIVVIGVGIVTAIWWTMRVTGRTTPPHQMVIVARSILVVGTVVGLAVLLPEVSEALRPV